MTNNLTYPFADIDLARRLERTEAQGNIDFVEARAKAFPEVGAQWTEIAGCFAMFDGAGSPLTQTFGLGISQPAGDADLEQIEQFFLEKGAEVFHEVSPLADATVLQLLTQRGYVIIEWSNVMFRPIDIHFSLQGSHNTELQVRQVNESEADLWAETAALGWGEFPELGDFLRELGRVTARSAARSFVAEQQGKPIATGALTIANDVGLLAGASTVPEARRQGAQLALLEGRLRYAAERGCTIAMMVASPGSGSQRNAERHGFRVAYTRAKWQLKR
jgi:hypothetical protein